MTDKNGREIVMGATVTAIDSKEKGVICGLTPEPNEQFPNGTVKLQFGEGEDARYEHVDAFAVAASK
jgi:hypothetical protein